MSLVSNGALISKIYFPRLVIPFSTSVVPLIDCLVTFSFFMIFSLFLGFIPKSTILFSFFFIGLCYFFSLGIGLWCAALNVRYRDIQYFVPLILQIGVYISPVMYPVRLVPDKWKTVYGLNPMVTIIEGFRWAIYDIGLIDTMALIWSVIMIFLIFISGLLYFQGIERTLVDTL
jgi:lipopolysaccharide transport system permease protein